MTRPSVPSPAAYAGTVYGSREGPGGICSISGEEDGRGPTGLLGSLNGTGSLVSSGLGLGSVCWPFLAVFAVGKEMLGLGTQIGSLEILEKSGVSSPSKMVVALGMGGGVLGLNASG